MDIIQKIDNTLNEEKDINRIRNVIEKIISFMKKNYKKGNIQVLKAITPTKVIIYDHETDTEIVLSAELNR